MGLLTKLGLVEEVPSNNYDEAVEEYSYVEETVEAELDEVNTDTLIDDIYAQNNLADKSARIRLCVNLIIHIFIGQTTIL